MIENFDTISIAMFARAASFRTKVLDKNNTEKVSFAVRGFIENFSLQFNNLFYNEVNRVVLPNAYLSATTDQIYVSFERGSKTLNTSLQNVNPKSTGIDINESMVIVSTMTPINDSQTDISYQVRLINMLCYGMKVFVSVEARKANCAAEERG